MYVKFSNSPSQMFYIVLGNVVSILQGRDCIIKTCTEALNSEVIYTRLPGE